MPLRPDPVDYTNSAETGPHDDSLIRELNHHVRNMLSVISAMASQTLGGSGDRPEVDAFVGRVDAMNRTYRLMTELQWRRLSFARLVAEALGALVEPGRFSLSGPTVLLSPREAWATGMVLHELVANAVSHGALSVPAGQVDVHWSSNAVTGEVAILWTERDGPPVLPPALRGFGLRLIERQLAHEVNGGSELIFDPAGLQVTLRLPASHAR
ncbi:two-component sensor histidine kinase [Luteibacter sp. Sphag1AF]|uniref:sensor histidine kinase n=1 Tax=Luteibacter sp. Sphag1AF TaxID=2587031 RepID=UPI001617E1CC|nr:sensor histidine kinase [Luteibacter sp. Sphag1AF]MBB3227970.1 two-component sensor histidine kinase [Luteibacter sp. Sphag1AF]